MSCIPMYAAMLREAAERHCQLVVTPEYTTPWEVVEAVARGDYRPPQGSLWALGCESIAPAALEVFGASLTNQPDIH
jgi:predicted amidohydrolase